MSVQRWTRVIGHGKDVVTMRLFLRSVSFILLSLGPLLPLANQACLAARITELPVRRLLAREVADLALLNCDLVGDREVLLALLDLALVSALLCRLHILGRSVTRLRRLDLAREEDETLLVLLQTCNVGLQRLLAQVLAAGVDGDTDGGRKLAGDTGFL